jgi:hypothetical protein
MISVGVIPTVTSLIVAVYIMKIVAEHRRQMKAQRRLLIIFYNKSFKILHKLKCNLKNKKIDQKIPLALYRINFF